jgi:hypothetical protein
MRPNLPLALSSTLTIALLTLAATAQAAASDAQSCLALRLKAAAKYESCQTKARLAFEASSDIGALKVASSKCRTKYTAVWPKLAAKFTGSFTDCDQPRFVDHGDSVRDNLTGLDWEKKVDDGSINDKDNAYYYSWPGDGDSTNADGNVFDIFLGLTSANFYGGVGDWRLPTREELQTLLVEPYPCQTSPCVSATLGLTETVFYLSSSSTLVDPLSIWVVHFGTEEATLFAKTQNVAVRAVRGGL